MKAETIVITVLVQGAAVTAFYLLIALINKLANKLPESKFKRLLLWDSERSRSRSVTQYTPDK